MMPPHPETVYDLQTMRYQELLAEAAQVRRADLAAVHRPRPPQPARLHVIAGRVLAWIGTSTSAARSSRRPAEAWS
jgi:hypothetical protein